jgi:hypothetical protein
MVGLGYVMRNEQHRRGGLIPDAQQRILDLIAGLRVRGCKPLAPRTTVDSNASMRSIRVERLQTRTMGIGGQQPHGVFEKDAEAFHAWRAELGKV